MKDTTLMVPGAARIGHGDNKIATVFFALAILNFSSGQTLDFAIDPKP